MSTGPIDVFNDTSRTECEEGYYFDPYVQACIPVYGSIPGQDGEGYSDEDKIAWAQGGQDIEGAELLQTQFNEFWNQYMPVAGYLQDRLVPETALPEQVANKARGGAAEAGLAARGSAQRGVSRYGADIKGNQQSYMDRTMALARNAGIAGAGTNAYRSMYDTNLATAQDFVSLGHGAKGEGLSGQLAANANTQNRLSAQYGMNMQSNNAASAANFQVGMAGAAAAGKMFLT